MKTVPIKNTGDQLTAEEFTEGTSQESQNAVLSTGQALNEADEFQLGKAMAVYGSAGDFYIDSGIANSYVLSPINIQQAPPAYTNGLRARFVATNTNTGNTTVNLDGLGAKSIKEGGAELISGRINAGDIIEISFLTSSDEFELVNFHTATLVPDVAATNGEVVSEVTFDDDGHVRTFTKRNLTASNGVILVGDDFQHEDTSSVSDVTATGDEVISSITFDSQGHVLTFTKRALTPADIGLGPSDTVTFGTILGDGSAPVGGAIDQVLTKISGTDYDYDWAALAGVPALGNMPLLVQGTIGISAGTGLNLGSLAPNQRKTLIVLTDSGRSEDFRVGSLATIIGLSVYNWSGINFDTVTPANPSFISGTQPALASFQTFGIFLHLFETGGDVFAVSFSMTDRMNLLAGSGVIDSFGKSSVNMTDEIGLVSGDDIFIYGGNLAMPATVWGQ